MYVRRIIVTFKEVTVWKIIKKNVIFLPITIMNRSNYANQTTRWSYCHHHWCRLDLFLVLDCVYMSLESCTSIEAQFPTPAICTRQINHIPRNNNENTKLIMAVHICPAGGLVSPPCSVRYNVECQPHFVSNGCQDCRQRPLPRIPQVAALASSDTLSPGISPRNFPFLLRVGKNWMK